MMYQGLHKRHLLPGVLHDDHRVLGWTPKEVWSKDHGEVGGVHLGDRDHLLPGEQLEELDQVGEDDLVEFRKSLYDTTGCLSILTHADGVIVKCVI